MRKVKIVRQEKEIAVIIIIMFIIIKVMGNSVWFCSKRHRFLHRSRDVKWTLALLLRIDKTTNSRENNKIKYNEHDDGVCVCLCMCTAKRNDAIENSEVKKPQAITEQT